MEHLLGVPLFDRTSSGVELTSYGQVLRRRTTNVTDELKQGLGELAFLADPTQGEIRVGTTEPMTALTATIVQNISNAYPKIRFVVSANDTLALHERLRQREIDIAVTRMAADFDRYEDLARKRCSRMSSPSLPESTIRWRAARSHASRPDERALAARQPRLPPSCAHSSRKHFAPKA